MKLLFYIPLIIFTYYILKNLIGTHFLNVLFYKETLLEVKFFDILKKRVINKLIYYI